ncbi:hypothetical protein CCMSSC00406_0004703 [Pleurotus cornucopiae]|uniref:Uncharacterized protein n=1 Tax=Pleurotus cornucopiae TaxID=5321 RepID=A0ACB7J0Z1_PLECO|nr:hypothetical protein CCMSSC00406_0004703 [Pleurotus cornucopiae]
MTNKKNKQRKRQAASSDAAAGNEGSSSPSTDAGDLNRSGQSPEASTSPPLPTTEPVKEDPIALAEKTKERGNVAFKEKRFAEAVELYTSAIDLNPNEPAYLTNRAASYMAMKRFRPALQDCQVALALQSSTPPPPSKTLIRLAKCQLALGLVEPALSTLRPVISSEPSNVAAIQLQRQITQLESHLRTFEKSRADSNWGMARLALDKCFQGIEGEGGEVPADWRLWKTELELARGALEVASGSANDALRLNPNSPDILALRGLILFISGKLPQALQHVQSALRLDPDHPRAQKLRKRVKDIERLKEEGNVLFKQGSLELAIEKYTEALERIGAADDECKGGYIRATLLSNRATTLLKLERYQEALEDTNVSIELNDSAFKVYRTRARINLGLEAFEEAVRDFKRAIELANTDGLTGPSDVRSLQNELRKAEVALKQSKTKDYYGILGVKRDCTEIEIKKAYRMQSLKHHPDKGGDEEKFKLVVEAHAVLSDPRRRQRYDMGEDDEPSGGDQFNGGFAHMDISELLAQFGGGGGGGFPSGGFHSGHSHGGGRQRYSQGYPF